MRTRPGTQCGKLSGSRQMSSWCWRMSSGPKFMIRPIVSYPIIQNHLLESSITYNMAKTNKKKGVTTMAPIQRTAGQSKNPSSKLQLRNLNKPKIERISATETRITNTEFFTALTVPAGATATKFQWDINPSTSEFGWANNLVRSYGKFRFEKLEFSYVSRVSTTRDGSVGFGLFYDAESADSWFDTSGSIGLALGTLSYCSEYATAPIYGGSHIGMQLPGDMSEWVGVRADCSERNRRLPWFTVDPSPGTDVNRRNLTAQAFLGAGVDFGLAGTVGYLYVTYSIVLSQTARAVTPPALSVARTISMGRSEPVPGLPPLPPPPQPEVATGDEES